VRCVRATFTPAPSSHLNQQLEFINNSHWKRSSELRWQTALPQRTTTNSQSKTVSPTKSVSSPPLSHPLPSPNLTPARTNRSGKPVSQPTPLSSNSPPKQSTTTTTSSASRSSTRLPSESGSGTRMPSRRIRASRRRVRSLRWVGRGWLGAFSFEDSHRSERFLGGCAD
jgi:hypothetical protein